MKGDEKNDSETHGPATTMAAAGVLLNEETLLLPPVNLLKQQQQQQAQEHDTEDHPLFLTSSFRVPIQNDEQNNDDDTTRGIHQLHHHRPTDSQGSYSTLEDDEPQEEDQHDDAHHLNSITTSPRSPNNSRPSSSLWFFRDHKRNLIILDKSAMQFAFRMALLLTLSALFVLVRTPSGWTYPDGMWVLVSVLFVCWFPAMDAASVIEKITQRLIGTFVGATLGLSCGFTSLFFWTNHPTQQTIFIAICVFVGSFFIVGAAGQCRVVGTDGGSGQKVIRAYAYATILCVLTFCICLLPFATPASQGAPQWERGVMRVVNVMVGCWLGALGAILVCPKSTASVLHEKTARQVKLCGEASEAVLHLAADQFEGKVQVNTLALELMGTPLQTTQRWKVNQRQESTIFGPRQRRRGQQQKRRDEEKRQKAEQITQSRNHADVALKKYEDAIADWKASKQLFPLCKYDPFLLVGSGGGGDGDNNSANATTKAFHKEIARTLARSLRIQTTVVLLDGMVRHDQGHSYDLFQKQELEMFRRIGTTIKQMLTVPLDVVDCNQAAVQLFDDLEVVRGRILNLSQAVAAQATDERSNQIRHDDMMQFRNALIQQRETPKSANTAAKSARPGVDHDDAGRGIPKFASNAVDNSLFLLQLVEHLILRSLRMYQAWKEVQVQARQLPDRTVRDLTVRHGENDSDRTWTTGSATNKGQQRRTRFRQDGIMGGQPGDSLRSLIGI